MTRIAIVGGGAAGTLALVHLARCWPDREPLDVVLYDGTGRVARGAAYSTTDRRHLLNVPAGRMSAVTEDDDHFVHWLQRRDPSATAADYRTRAEFGSYLAHCLAAHARRVGLVVRHAQVGDLTRTGDRWFVTHERGTEVADAVVLALGHAPPVTLPAVCRPGPGYVADPWQQGAIEELLRTTAPGDTILTVGTGLTAVDVALSLVPAGRGIVAVSRRGLLPHAQLDRAPTPVPLPGSDVPTTLTAESLEDLVRGHVRAVTAKGADWRAAIDGLRPITSNLWRRLSTPERAAILAGPVREWEVARHRMAPKVAAAIASYRQNGGLEVRAGELLAAVCSAGRSRVSIRSGAHVERLEVAAVVNCTGPTCDIERYPGGLGRRLTSRGLVRVDPLGLGIETTDDGRVVDASGRSDARFGAIGALRRGSLFESTAIPELRDQAASLASLLATELTGRRYAAL